MSIPPLPKAKIPPKSQPPRKKKNQQSASDRPQPRWLFPLDEENPVLNPRLKTEEEKMKEKQQRVKSLDYMKRRVHAAPDQPAPPPQLLTLIGVFLTEFGFNSTSRLFTNERKARQTLSGWEDAIGQKLEKNTPSLEKIYRDWYRDSKASQKDETSSSDTDSSSESETSDEDTPHAKRGEQRSSSDGSEASSDGSSGSDVDMEEASKLKKAKTSKKARKNSVSSLSSGSFSSDSDADDEAAEPKKGSSSSKVVAVVATKPSVGAMVNNPKKRKAPSSSSSSSDSESSEEEQIIVTKKAKTGSVTSFATTSVSVSKPTESSDSDSSSSSSDGAADGPQLSGVTLPSQAKASSDSSATVNGDAKEYSTSTSVSESSSTSASDSDGAPPVKKAVAAKQTPEKKTHQGAKPTPLAELSAQADDESHISNKYQPYDYAERAYKDLSVTRGKGFTKEKNKKKKGSYRGGPIDMSGGKGFKFED